MTLEDLKNMTPQGADFAAAMAAAKTNWRESVMDDKEMEAEMEVIVAVAWWKVEAARKLIEEASVILKKDLPEKSGKLAHILDSIDDFFYQ